MRPNSKKGRRIAKIVGGHPNWLKTACIAKRGAGRRPITGTFGPASPVTIIKPGEA